MLTSREIAPDGKDESCTLSYEDRFLRRKVLQMDTGEPFLADLARTTSMDQGMAFVLSDGRRVAVRAAEEPLMEITSDALLRLIWHIGNRHCPAQIEATRVLVQPDHVIRDLMEKLGANVRDVVEPFTPEGGAYGHGRTHGHDHSHTHADGDSDGHSHDHSHDHGH